MTYVIIAILGACWGSVLNAIAWRIISGKSITYYRSYCPKCEHHIAWYDLFPIISWLWLRGRCRHCHAPIHILYPCVELFSAACAIAGYITLSHSTYIWYGIYSSLLIITLHTDFRYHLISPWVTMYAIPVQVYFAYTGALSISWYESIIAAAFGYSLFRVVNAIFKHRKETQAIGEGDWELIAYIASGIGFHGLAYTMLWGSSTALLCIIFKRKDQKPIHAIALPFGACLSLIATVYPLLYNN